MAFLGNILWLNIKKLRLNLFWKILFILVNIMLFASALLMNDMSPLMPIRANIYLLVVVTLSNTLFTYVKISSELHSVSLFRSMGASRAFIIVNNMMEILLLFMISLVIFSTLLLFYKVNGYLFLWSLLEIVFILIEVFFFSLYTIRRAEKIDKA